VDGQTAAEYEQDLRMNLQALLLVQFRPFEGIPEHHIVRHISS
jgi:hypothetical protein